MKPVGERDIHNLKQTGKVYDRLMEIYEMN
jgi:hypothetical protein